MIFKCRHIKTNGNVCGSPALKDKPYCYYHTRLHAFARAAKTPSNEPLQLPVLEDNSSIQLALAQIMGALATSRINTKQAGLFLRGLQIAMKNLDYDHPATLLKTVKTLSLTDDGDELAPENHECERPQDCVACEKHCRWYKPQED